MSKKLNLAKGRTYVVTTSAGASVVMGTSPSQVTVDIEAPQGLFVATAEEGTISDESAVVRQLFFGSGAGAGGVGGKSVKLTDTFDPEDNTMATTGMAVAEAVKLYGFKTKVLDHVPTVDEAEINTIYLAPADSEKEGNVYNEYIKVETSPGVYTIENVGSTAVDLEFIEHTDEHIALAYNTKTSGTTYKFEVSNKVVDGVTTGEISYTKTVGDTTTKLASASIDNLAVISDYGFVQEASTDVVEGGNGSFIDDRVLAILNSRTIRRVALVNGAQTILNEDDIGYITGTGTALNLSQLTCKLNATAELWIDIPSSVTSQEITVPVATWLEGEAPSSLAPGKRYVFIIRNDGTESVQHLIMNQAYSYDI